MRGLRWFRPPHPQLRTRRGILTGVALAGLSLAILEGTTGIDHTNPALVPGGRLVHESVWANREQDFGAFAVDYVAARGWVPRGEPPEIIAVRQVTGRALNDAGMGFGEGFYRTPESPNTLVVLRGLLNYQQGSLTKYRPHPPQPGEMVLIWNDESTSPFFRGNLPDYVREAFAIPQAALVRPRIDPYHDLRR